MLELGFIRENRAEIIERMSVRNLSAKDLVDNAIELDQKRRETQKKFDDLQAEMNQISKRIGQLFQEGKKEDAVVLKGKTAVLKGALQPLKEEMASAEVALREVLYQIPI